MDWFHGRAVENLSYKKDSWINNKRQFKRHTRAQWLRGHAARAVDGDASTNTAQTCTVLDNFYVDKPTWMVDLGQKVSVSGVKIVTWQGRDQGEASSVDCVSCSLICLLMSSAFHRIHHN